MKTKYSRGATMTAVAIREKDIVGTKKPRVVVYLEDSDKNLLELLAESRNRSVSNLIETLIKQEIAKALATREIKETPR